MIRMVCDSCGAWTVVQRALPLRCLRCRDGELLPTNETDEEIQGCVAMALWVGIRRQPAIAGVVVPVEVKHGHS